MMGAESAPYRQSRTAIRESVKPVKHQAPLGSSSVRVGADITGVGGMRTRRGRTLKVILVRLAFIKFSTTPTTGLRRDVKGSGLMMGCRTGREQIQT